MSFKDCLSREGDSNFEAVVNTAHDGVIGLSSDGRVWGWNPAAEDLFKLPRAEILGQNISKIKVPPSSDLWQEVQRIGVTPSSAGQLEIEVSCGNKAVLPVWISISSMPAGEEHMGGFGLIVRDMSDKRKVEDGISEALHQRNELLKELHHRVKNNLQLICSLLRLQAKEARDEHAVTLLRKSEDRIRSLAVVHDTLYRSPNFSSINFANCLRQLTVQLIRSAPGRIRELEPVFDLEEVELPIDSATTCALVANELTSTFLERASLQLSEITCSLKVSLKMDGTLLRLGIYSDSKDEYGPASPPGASPLGINLVEALLKQMGGTLETEPHERAGFLATIPLPLSRT